MQFLPLLVVLLNYIEFSSQEAVAEDEFTLSVNDDQVQAVVDVPFNFTISIHNLKWTNKPVVVRRLIFFRG